MMKEIDLSSVTGGCSGGDCCDGRREREQPAQQPQWPQWPSANANASAWAGRTGRASAWANAGSQFRGSWAQSSPFRSFFNQLERK